MPPNPAADPPAQIDLPARPLDALFTSTYPTLVRLALRISGNAAAAEELASEAFWRFHRNPPTGCHNPEGWLYRTTLRLAFDYLRHHKRRIFYEAQAPLPTASPNPEQSFDLEQRRARVRQVLAALKARDAELLILRSEGYTLAEMAALLNLRANSIGVFLSRADESFRKEYLKRYGTC